MSISRVQRKAGRKALRTAKKFGRGHLKVAKKGFKIAKKVGKLHLKVAKKGFKVAKKVGKIVGPGMALGMPGAGLVLKKLLKKNNTNVPKVRKYIRRERLDKAADKRGGRSEKAQTKTTSRREATDAKDVKHFAKNEKAAERVQSMYDRSNKRLGRSDKGPIELQKEAAAKAAAARRGRSRRGRRNVGRRLNKSRTASRQSAAQERRASAKSRIKSKLRRRNR